MYEGIDTSGGMMIHCCLFAQHNFKVKPASEEEIREALLKFDIRLSDSQKHPSVFSDDPSALLKDSTNWCCVILTCMDWGKNSLSFGEIN